MMDTFFDFDGYVDRGKCGIMITKAEGFGMEAMFRSCMQTLFLGSERSLNGFKRF